MSNICHAILRNSRSLFALSVNVKVRSLRLCGFLCRCISFLSILGFARNQRRRFPVAAMRRGREWCHPHREAKIRRKRIEQIARIGQDFIRDSATVEDLDEGDESFWESFKRDTVDTVWCFRYVGYKQFFCHDFPSESQKEVFRFRIVGFLWLDVVIVRLFGFVRDKFCVASLMA